MTTPTSPGRAVDRATGPAGDPVADLMQALAVLGRDFDLVLDRCTGTDDWQALVVNLARAREVIDYASATALRAANDPRRGQISVRDLAHLVGRGKSQVADVIRAGREPSGDWLVTDTAGGYRGHVYGKTEDDARYAAEITYGPDTTVRSVSGHEQAAAELAAEAEHARPRPA